MRRILTLFFFALLVGSGIAVYFLQDSLDSPWIHWVFSKFSFWIFLLVLILSTLAMIRIFRRAKKAIRSQNEAMEKHLSGILDELVQDSQALGEFLKIDLPQMEERIKRSKDIVPKEIHSAYSANWTKIRTEAESALRDLDTLPLEPDRIEEEKSKKTHAVLEYKDLLNRHTKAKKILERVRSDLSLLKEKLSEKGC
ncbi:ABC transporter ATP-binding protein [Leptospira wolffii]|uniref:Uncharacterized protein n=1 Tax=Leptospira wolffii TaxID=409998 RepID=A0A2M9ZAE6_9LEPT|nr:ABC transporter ATP-binding protein [Leptospira wolffii]PJZ65416.1 hypothetical protein CH371_13575 [Leptospira wolffii]TGK64707.1 ABC transporter ATP-binding protein [Leptospira wolffii]TGK76894.1 ABC transporter ATP-binding protein [Leptospira wolffii]TGK77254.1 ABC transporter ATP-binding protein [Leptospira wolffii]TGL26649.1 ABC transporter ATP-binding protein [Leptospira wolffii]